MTQLSPDLIAALQAKGIIPPPQGAPPPQAAPTAAPQASPFGPQFAGSGMSLPSAPPQSAPATQQAPQAQAMPAPSFRDARALDPTYVPPRTGNSRSYDAQAYRDARALDPTSNQPTAGPAGTPQDAGAQQGQQAPPSAFLPMRIIPAHEVRAVSPGTEKLYEKAGAEKMAAAGSGESAEQGSNEANAHALDQIAAQLQAQRDAQRKAEETRQKMYDAQQADYERIRKDAEGGKVTSNGVGFAGAIAIGLGSLGAALSHTPNFALETINKRIDTDLAKQRANMENKRASADEARTGLGAMRARFGDDRMAEQAERASQLEQAKVAGDSLIARANSPMLAAKWQATRAGLDEEQANLHAKMFPWMQAQVAGGAAQKPLDNVFMGSDGQRYQARDPDSRKKLVASEQSYGSINSELSDYEKALSQVSATDKAAAKLGYQTTAMSRANTAYNAVMTAVRQAHDDGVWKKGEVEMLANTLVPPDHFTGDPSVQIAVARKQAADAHANAMRIEDPLPVQQGFAQTPQGALAPRNAYTGQTVAHAAPHASNFVRPVGQ